MISGTFISGNLDNLGWAVYRGCDFEKDVFKQLRQCPTSWWKSINKDTDRKYFLLQSYLNSRQRKIENTFEPIRAKVFKLCESIIQKQGYQPMNMSIFKNDGNSDGQMQSFLI